METQSRANGAPGMRIHGVQCHNRRVGTSESEPRAELIATIACPEWPNVMPVFHMPEQAHPRQRYFTPLYSAYSVFSTGQAQASAKVHHRPPSPSKGPRVAAALAYNSLPQAC